MQSVPSRIWTRVAVSISYDDNHYSTGTCRATYHLSRNLSKFDQPDMQDTVEEVETKS